MDNRRGFLLLPIFVLLSLTLRAQLVPGIVASSYQNGGGSGDANAVAFKTATGITGTNASAIDSLVKWLKDSALWSSAIAIYPMIGGTQTTNSYNLIDTTKYRLTFSGGWTYSANGILGNSSNTYANTGWNPYGASLNADHDMSMGIYSRTNVSGTYVDIGCATDSTVGQNRLQFYLNFSSTFYGQININDNISQNMANTNSQGWFFGSKAGYSSSNYFLQIDAVQSDEATAAANKGVPNNNLYIGAQNVNGVAKFFAPRQYAFVWIGLAINKAQGLTLYRIIQKYQTLLSRQVTHP